jgi:hypothetical protein
MIMCGGRVSSPVEVWTMNGLTTMNKKKGCVKTTLVERVEICT